MTQFDSIISKLKGYYPKCEKRESSIAKGISTLESNESIENTRKMLHSTMNVLRDQMEINKLLIQFINLNHPTNKTSNNDKFDIIDKIFGGR